ncbi:translation initiation factor eIF 4e-like domain-containing protein [Multifurca ochricompacta]|uniref:Translation initiation factor eIF 4e-like domain-containing protein n=1 Tax=Multifurca ochricompacta TaxID=376703 RepID=A0AAD4M5A0_9AGAM|nr:translation initiation factor eIF 4e-like domain-containing protein [Multifurca ochricompacta]
MSTNSTTTTGSDLPKPERPSSSSTRLPSLNQLAARIGANRDTTTTIPQTNSTTNRPRLAASLLRTGSQTSVSTATSLADSIAVNVPVTRSTSPAALSTSPPNSTNGSVNGDAVATAGPGEPLTTEKVEKLAQETAVLDKRLKKTKGFKNIPTLDAITARYARTRTLSVDGTAVPPEAEPIEDPQTPGVMTKPAEHPLQHSWTIYHDTKAKVPFSPMTAADTSYPAPADSGAYEAGLTTVGEFDTVESYCRYFNWLKPPSKLERNSNYHLFKSGIKPMWEDEANANGGKWVLTMKNNPVLLDQCWQWLTMALVGEELDEGDEICGAVVSLRSKVDRIQLWTRSKDDVEKVNGIGRKLVKLLDVSEADSIGLEFQYNTEDRPLPNKFLSIQSVPQSSFRPTFNVKGGSPVTGPGELPVPAPAPAPIGVGPGGAFGSFGVNGSGVLGGGGGGGATGGGARSAPPVWEARPSRVMITNLGHP